VMHALVAAGVAAEDAYNAVQGVRNMAGQTILETLGAKIDAQNARFDAMTAGIAALQDQLRRERAMLWAVIALLGAAVLRFILGA